MILDGLGDSLKGTNYLLTCLHIFECTMTCGLFLSDDSDERDLFFMGVGELFFDFACCQMDGGMYALLAHEGEALDRMDFFCFCHRCKEQLEGR